MVQAVPEERQLMAASVIAQEELRTRLQMMTPKMIQFLKFRLMFLTDAEARHAMGRNRRDGNQAIKCMCGLHQPGFIDLRNQTLLAWKQDQNFIYVYRLLLEQPLLYAATRLEQLAPMAVKAYEDIFTDPDVKPSVKRLAAKDVIQAGGLLAVEGVNAPQRSAVNESMAMIVAREKLRRGLELAPDQQRMLREAGMNVGQQQINAPVAAATERTLDGEDVEAEWRELELPD